MKNIELFRRVAITVLFAAAVLALAACAPAAPTPTAEPEQEALIPASELVQPGKLTIATTGNVAPWGTLGQDGELQGYDVDVCNAFAERVGLEADWVVIEWAGVLPGVATSRFDMACTGVGLTQERVTSPDFLTSIGTVQGGGAIFVREDEDRFKTWDDLRGMTLGANRGAWYGPWVRDNILEGDVNLKEYTSTSEVFLDLGNGRVDFVASNTLDTALVKEHAAKRILDEYNPTPYGVAIRKQAPSIRREINLAIMEWQQDGTLKDWQVKWWGEPHLIGGE